MTPTTEPENILVELAQLQVEEEQRNALRRREEYAKNIEDGKSVRHAWWLAYQMYPKNNTIIS